MRPSPKKHHTQYKKEFRPPLMSHDFDWTFYSWERDEFPAALWIVNCFVTLDHNTAMHCIKAVLDRTQDCLDSHYEELESPEEERILIDGYLTTFAAIPVDARQQVLEVLEKDGLLLIAFPEELFHVFGMYPDLDIQWLVDHWGAQKKSVDWETALDQLSDCVFKGLDGKSHTATNSKYMLMYATHKAGKVHYSEHTKQVIDDFVNYPMEDNPDALARTRASIRASFGALSQAMNGHLKEERSDWSRSFWNKNWSIYPCYFSDEKLETQVENLEQEIRLVLEEWHIADDQFEIWLSGQDPLIYSFFEWEVVTAMVARCLRVTKSILDSSLMLAPEYTSSCIRMLAETRILLAWLFLQDDEGWYLKLREFGRGKLKLYMLNLEEARNRGAQVDDAIINSLRSRVNRDSGEEFLTIDLDSSFNKLSMRTMAKQTDLTEVYNLYFAPASTDVHGEWGSLEWNYLDQCLNPLHRGHKVPKSRSDIRVVDIMGLKNSMVLLREIIDSFRIHYDLPMITLPQT